MTVSSVFVCKATHAHWCRKVGLSGRDPQRSNYDSRLMEHAMKIPGCRLALLLGGLTLLTNFAFGQVTYNYTVLLLVGLPPGVSTSCATN